MLLGEEDPVVPLSVGHEVAGRLAKGTLTTFPGDLHDVLNEHDRDLVHRTVLDWLAGVADPLPVPWHPHPE